MNPIMPLLALSSILSSVWLVIRANLGPSAGRDRVASTAQRAGEQAQASLTAQSQAAIAAREALAAEQTRQEQERARVDAQAKAAAAERQQAESTRLAAEAARLKQEAAARADAAEAQKRADQEARERAAATQAQAEADEQRRIAAAAEQREREAEAQRNAQAAEAAARAAEAEQARAAATATAQLAAQQAAELQAQQAAAVTPPSSMPSLPPPEPEPSRPAASSPPMPPPGAGWAEKLRTGALALQSFLAANQTPGTAPGAYGYKDHPSQPVLLFQRLANTLIAQGAPGPQLAEDGIFGPKTATRAQAVGVALPVRPITPAAAPIAARPAATGPVPNPPPVPIGPTGYDPLAAKTLAQRVEANLRQKIQQGKRNDYDRALMKQFQVAAGLKPDGIYGGATRGAMLYFGRTRAPQPFAQPLNTIQYTPPRAAA